MRKKRGVLCRFAIFGWHTVVCSRMRETARNVAPDLFPYGSYTHTRGIDQLEHLEGYARIAVSRDSFQGFRKQRWETKDS